MKKFIIYTKQSDYQISMFLHHPVKGISALTAGNLLSEHLHSAFTDGRLVSDFPKINTAQFIILRRVTNLGNQERWKVFWGCPNFLNHVHSFKLCPTHFSRWGSTLVTGLIILYFSNTQTRQPYLWHGWIKLTVDHFQSGKLSFFRTISDHQTQERSENYFHIWKSSVEFFLVVILGTCLVSWNFLIFSETGRHTNEKSRIHQKDCYRHPLDITAALVSWQHGFLPSLLQINLKTKVLSSISVHSTVIPLYLVE